MPKSSLSVVTTLYYSQDYIVEFYERILKCIQEIGFEDYEIIFVDDGSPDNSLKVAVGLHEKDNHVKVIELSRNFGHHKAMMTGLSHAKNDFVFLIDVDLEEEPELLLTFWKELNKSENNDVDVIYGVQEKRKGGWFERRSGEVFYYAFRKLASVNIDANIAVARLMKSHYVRALTSHRESEVFFAGLLSITGFNQKKQSIVKHSTSSTTYSASKKITQTVNAITSFSNSPLKVIFYTGSLISSITFMFICYYFIQWLVFEKPASGWTSVILSIWILGGMTIFFLGIIGLYLARIYSETKNRPYTIEKKIYNYE